MEMEDHDFQVVRKNLNILSVLILILAFTNAQLHTINLLGIDMELDGNKLYQALFLGYIYLLWRFLTKLPLRGGFWNDFLQYYLDSEEGVKKHHHYERYKELLIEKSPRLKRAIEDQGELKPVQLRFVRFSEWPLTKLRLAASFQSRTDQSLNETPSFSIDHDIHVPRIYQWYRLIMFSVKYDKFGDYLFPLIPVLINFYFFTVKTEWQGSFYHLFLK